MNREKLVLILICAGLTILILAAGFFNHRTTSSIGIGNGQLILAFHSFANRPASYIPTLPPMRSYDVVQRRWIMVSLHAFTEPERISAEDFYQRRPNYRVYSWSRHTFVRIPLEMALIVVGAYPAGWFLLWCRRRLRKKLDIAENVATT